MATDLKTYLGDGVYADISDGMIQLTTEDGVRVTNTIFLEPEVYQSLLNFVATIRRAGPHGFS